MRNANADADPHGCSHCHPEEKPKRTAPYAYGGPYASLSQERMKALHEECTPAEWYVLSVFLLHSESFTTPVRKNITQIATELRLSRPNVSKIIAKLRERRILIVWDKDAKIPHYRLSPYLGGKGPGIEQREAIRWVNPPELDTMDIKPAPIPYERRERSA